MATTEIVPDWARASISFFAGNLPRRGEAYDHGFVTADQIGCEALAAFGEVDETSWGAVARASAKLPETLPRWDDVCVAVLGLAEQRSRLTYHPKTPTSAGLGAGAAAARRESSPPPNITSAHGLGPAHADPGVFAVLSQIGLIAGERWTADAELVLWREQPAEWDLDIASDPRFSDAVNNAVDSIPDDIRAQMYHLVAMTEGNARAPVADRETHGKEPAVEGRRASPHLRNELDWIFFRRWRLSDGWLSEEQVATTLEVFHDALAIQMRCAVIAALYPEYPEFHA